MIIRGATDRDRDDIRRVHACAFPDGESGSVAKLALDVLSERASPPTISLVAETDAAVVGHIAFSPVTIEIKEDIRAYILAPLGVKPDYQRCGIGSKLNEPGDW